MKFRNLTKDEIEVRIGQLNKDYNYITLLLYKDSRVDMNILDETVGATKWQRKHYEVKGNMYCSVGVKCEDEWVWKDDCGTESYTEKEKGEASDSFKRACVNWGIGRELYTSPKIFINCEVEEKKPKFLTSFEVTHIRISENKVIEELTISAYHKGNKSKETIFEYELNRFQKKNTIKNTIPIVREPALIKLVEDLGADYEEVIAFLKKQNNSTTVTNQQLEDFIIKLTRKREKEKQNETI